MLQSKDSFIRKVFFDMANITYWIQKKAQLYLFNQKDELVIWCGHYVVTVRRKVFPNNYKIEDFLFLMLQRSNLDKPFPILFINSFFAKNHLKMRSFIFLKSLLSFWLISRRNELIRSNTLLYVLRIKLLAVRSVNFIKYSVKVIALIWKYHNRK